MTAFVQSLAAVFELSYRMLQIEAPFELLRDTVLRETPSKPAYLTSLWNVLKPDLYGVLPSEVRLSTPPPLLPLTGLWR